MSISKKFFEKHMLIHYVLSAFFKALLVSVLFFAVLFASLQITGKYTAVENMLDLKYDSPWIIGFTDCRNTSRSFVYCRYDIVFV